MADDEPEMLQRDTLRYFLAETNRANGLVPDSIRTGSPSSITAIGFALAAYAVGAERKVISPAAAVERVLTTLRFLWQSPHGVEQDATGYQGFLYHFLDMQTGGGAWESELSTIDATFLMAGALAAAMYFDEQEIRTLADALYRRVDRQWAQDGGKAVTHRWTPERGFLRYRWEGYKEALLLYVLGLGSPTHPLRASSREASTRTYSWKKLYGHEFLYAGPLFIHQLSHVWIDFGGIQDDYMRERAATISRTVAGPPWRSSSTRSATRQFKGYGEHRWGITASDGPGPAIRPIDGIERRFYDYKARSVPSGPDDGTIAPGRRSLRCRSRRRSCYRESVISAKRHSGRYYGLDQGPIFLMIENYRSGLTWNSMKQCPYLLTGLRRAGFANGWLSAAA